MRFINPFGNQDCKVCLHIRIGLICLLIYSVMISTAESQVVALNPQSKPVIQKVEPVLMGVGGKIKITGRFLGDAHNAVVLFNDSVIATTIESHQPDQIIARVPIGAYSGNLKVVVNVDASSLKNYQLEYDLKRYVDSETVQAEAQTISHSMGYEVRRGRSSNDTQTQITFAFIDNSKLSSQLIDDSEGLAFIRHRIIIDLRDFLSFETALEIADQYKADLVGYFPITNSYVLDLRTPPANLKELDKMIALMEKDPRVVEAWKDMALKSKQLDIYANVDMVNRYRHNYSANLHGRMDAYNTDRIQAPGAWNLIERFLPSRDGRPAGRASLHPMRLLVMDTGCHQGHPEFNGVDLKKIVIAFLRLRIAGRDVILPGAVGEAPYNLGDADADGHGTMVTSLIAARNNEVIGGNAQGDRGINGILHNPMPYTVYINRGSDWSEAGDWSTVTEFLSSINAAALHGIRIMSASWGQPYPIDMVSSVHRNEVRVSLRKLAHQLNQFHDRLLLVVAAGNEADIGSDPEFLRGRITPFEDINLNNRLDAGEDLDGNGVLTHGNYVAASLGTLPNVLTVGAISQNDQRAEFSNWGIPVKIAAPGVNVLMAKPPGGDGFNIGGARYVKNSGTSMATPLVAGSAALLLGIQNTLAPAELKTRLIDSAFTVNTTDYFGGLLTWNTLKTGFAVRQLMLDRGIITNNQRGTGVSKLVVTTYQPNSGQYRIGVLEVRRGTGGRSEGFDFRVWNSDQQEHSPALTHDGQWVSYYYKLSSTELWTYKLPTQVHQRVDTSVGPNGMGFALGYSPNDTLIYSFRRGSQNPQVAWELWSYDINGTFHLAADTGWIDIPLAYFLHSVSFRPDNRQWTLAYSYYNNTPPNGTINGFINRPFSNSSTTNIPLLTSQNQITYFSYSPDGYGWTWLNGTQLVTAYPTSPTATSHSREFRETPADFSFKLPPKGGLCWSPDGSELAYSYTNNASDLAKIISVRRDHRNLVDRSYTTLYQLLGANSLIGTLSWQW